MNEENNLKFPPFSFLIGDESVVTEDSLRKRRAAMSLLGNYFNKMGLMVPAVMASAMTPTVESLFQNLPLAVHTLKIQMRGFDGPFIFTRNGKVAEENNRIVLNHNPEMLETDELLGFSEYLPEMGKLAGI